MKNILGKEEELKLYNEEGKLVYRYYFDQDGNSYEYTRDSMGNTLTAKNSKGVSQEWTYDSKGKEVSFKNSNGKFWYKTYNSNGDK